MRTLGVFIVEMKALNTFSTSSSILYLTFPDLTVKRSHKKLRILICI